MYYLNILKIWTDLSNTCFSFHSCFIPVNPNCLPSTSACVPGSACVLSLCHHLVIRRQNEPLFCDLLSSSSSSPGFICRCHQVLMMCQGRSCSPANGGALTSQTSPTTLSICGASWRTALGRSSPRSPCPWVLDFLMSLTGWRESVRLMCSSPLRSGKLQRAFVDAAATLRRLGVPRAFG